MGGKLVGQQEHQIDVRERRQFAAPVTASGSNAQKLPRRRVGGRIDAAKGEVINAADQLIDQIGVGAQHIAARRFVVLEAPADFRPAPLMGGFEDFKDLALGFRAIAGPPNKVLQFAKECLAVDDVAGFGYVGHGADDYIPTPGNPLKEERPGPGVILPWGYPCFGRGPKIFGLLRFRFEFVPKPELPLP